MASQQPDDPFIERPDEHVVDQELYCWVPSNADRECGPDCVAYDERFKREPKVSSCTLLNLGKSVALSLAQISQPLIQLNKRAETTARADKLKDVTSDPPVVR